MPLKRKNISSKPVYYVSTQTGRKIALKQISIKYKSKRSNEKKQNILHSEFN